MSSAGTLGDLASGIHLAQFYKANEQAMVIKACQFLLDGWERGDHLVVIATARHRRQFARELARAGIHWDAAIRASRLTVLDARETLERVTLGEEPDWERFQKVLGGLTERLFGSTGPALSVYQEMAGTLWSQGQYERAVMLEIFWSRMICAQFNLFCGYPIDVLSAEFQTPRVEALLGLHTGLVSSEAHGDLSAAIGQAIDEIIGPEASGAAAIEAHRAPDAASPMPRAEATIQWLRTLAPDRAESVLNLARKYLREGSGNSSTEGQGTVLAPFFRQLTHRERDALRRFYVLAESSVRIHEATGIGEQELGELRARARAYYREHPH